MLVGVDRKMGQEYECGDMASSEKTPPAGETAPPAPPADPPPAPSPAGDKPPREVAKEKGGPKGPDPTRYGDWERGGRCIDF